MARNIDTYDDDEENEDEKPVERPRPKAVPTLPVPAVELPASPEAAAAAMEEKPMSPIEEVVHRAGPRAGGKIFPFKRKIAGMGAVPPRLPEGAVLTPDARIAPAPSVELVRATPDTMRIPEPEVIVVPVAPTPAPPNGIAGLVMGLLAIGGAVLLASMLSGTGEMSGPGDDDDEDDNDDDDLGESMEGDSELERALAAPIEIAAPPKKRRKKAPKLEETEDVIEGEIVESEEDAA